MDVGIIIKRPLSYHVPLMSLVQISIPELQWKCLQFIKVLLEPHTISSSPELSQVLVRSWTNVSFKYALELKHHPYWLIWCLFHRIQSWIDWMSLEYLAIQLVFQLEQRMRNLSPLPSTLKWPVQKRSCWITLEGTECIKLWKDGNIAGNSLWKLC